MEANQVTHTRTHTHTGRQWPQRTGRSGRLVGGGHDRDCYCSRGERLPRATRRRCTQSVDTQLIKTKPLRDVDSRRGDLDRSGTVHSVAGRAAASQLLAIPSSAQRAHLSLGPAMCTHMYAYEEYNYCSADKEYQRRRRLGFQQNTETITACSSFRFSVRGRHSGLSKHFGETLDLPSFLPPS